MFIKLSLENCTMKIHLQAWVFPATICMFMCVWVREMHIFSMHISGLRAYIQWWCLIWRNLCMQNDVTINWMISSHYAMVHLLKHKKYIFARTSMGKFHRYIFYIHSFRFYAAILNLWIDKEQKKIILSFTFLCLRCKNIQIFNFHFSLSRFSF